MFDPHDVVTDDDSSHLETDGAAVDILHVILTRHQTRGVRTRVLVTRVLQTVTHLVLARAGLELPEIIMESGNEIFCIIYVVLKNNSIRRAAFYFNFKR